MRTGMLIIASFALAFPGCSVASSDASASQDSQVSLELVWTLDGFETPEGAALAPNGDYFISNIAGDIREKDGRGWVSRLSPDGSVLDQFWSSGLDAPKGMVVREGALYVSDIDTVVVLDADTGERLRSIPIPGAAFLNDMTVWRDQIVVSDSSNSTIYSISDDMASELVRVTNYKQLNGLLEDRQGNLLITSMGSGALLSFDGEVVSEIVSNTLGKPDGIGLAPDSGYLVSSFPGQIFHVQRDGNVSLLLDTRRQDLMQNDLSVFGEIVVVPNMQPGTVTAWKMTCAC